MKDMKGRTELGPDQSYRGGLAKLEPFKNGGGYILLQVRSKSSTRPILCACESWMVSVDCSPSASG